MDCSLEDGELSNDSDCYTPVKHPDNYSSFYTTTTTPQPIINESDSPEDTSSDSGSDSDGATKQKRPKLKPIPKRAQIKSAISKYNVWSTRIQEEVLVDTLNTCDVTKKDRSRDVESYDYPVREDYGENISGRDLPKEFYSKGKKKHKDHKQKNKDDQSNTESNKIKRKNNKRSFDDRKNKDLRLVRKKADVNGTGTPRYLIDLSVTKENTEEEIAKDLANKLFEEKEDLLLKIVPVIGKERSIKIFQDVKRIEKNGGMLIMNQSRRRTPGGVYLFLVKHEDNLTKEQHNRMFEEDKQKTKESVRAMKKKESSVMKAKYSKKNISDLLKTGGLCIEKLDESKWANEKLQTEHDEVKNPPPTPETDCADNIEDFTDRIQSNNEPISRNQQEYDEDFLDLGTTNDMDLF